MFPGNGVRALKSDGNDCNLTYDHMVERQPDIIFSAKGKQNLKEALCYQVSLWIFQYKEPKHFTVCDKYIELFLINIALVITN